MIYIIGDSHVSVFSGTDKTHNGLTHIQPEFGTCYTLSQGQLRPHINKFEQRIPYFCPIKTGSNTAWNSYEKLPRIEQAISEYKITNNDYKWLHRLKEILQVLTQHRLITFINLITTKILVMIGCWFSN